MKFDIVDLTDDSAEVTVSREVLRRMERRLTSTLNDPDARIDLLSKADIRGVLLTLRELQGD